MLFYVLTRLIKYPDLEIAVESIEDATIYYNVSDGTTTKLVTEYVQCKKHEKRDGGSVHVGSNEQDRWLKGTFYIAELEKWIDTEREGIVTADLLKANPDSFYTALVFGYLQNKLERFVPKDLKPYLPILYPLPYLDELFPATYRHTEDPSATAKKKLGGEEPRKRIRIVPTGSPQELKTMCWFMLTNATFYGVSKHKADNVLNQLQNIIIEASQVQGTISGQELIAIAREARAELGIWQSADRILRKEYDNPSDINKGVPLNWHDFEHQRFANRPEFATTWNIVKDQGAFVVISGAVGTGKTSLCMYLMYSFLKASPNNRAYYLSVLPATPLTDEVEFLESNIETDTLFIIDDEHVAAEEVRSLIEKFWDYKTSAKARLIVSSKTNYGRTEALAAGRTAKELRQAIQVALPHNSIETVEQLISEIRLKTQLKTQLSDRELATLSGGVLGEALLIARATRELIGSSTMEGIFNKHQLKSQITGWILSYLPELNSEDDFNSQVAPIFVISAFGLPVPESYSSSLIDRLHLIGFLERYDAEENSRLYRASDTNLAFILQSQHKHAHLSILKDYIERYPRWLPHTFTRVADWKESQDTLERLSQRKLDLIINVIKDPSSEFSLTDIVSILQSVRWASRGTARTIYRRWALPFGQPNEYFLPDIIAKARNVKELTRLLNLVVRIDKDVLIATRLAESQLMPHEARIILFHITEKSCQVDEAAACLHALRSYSKKFADQLYETLTNSPEFVQKLSGAESSDNGLFVLLRYCEQIKGINRADAYRSVERYLPKDKIVDTILVKLGNINPLSQFLLRLHRLYPIWAANVLSIILTSHAVRFTSLLQQEKNFDTLSQELHSFSQVNRLAAVQITYGIFAHLVELLQSERKYSIIGANIETIRKYISTNLARRLSDSMDEDEVLQLLLRERRYVDVVGRFLFLLSKASPGKASWFEEQLDYRFFLRVARAPRLRDVVILMRGFLAAASFQRVGQLQQRMLSDSSLIGLFKKRWQEANTLTEIGFCLVSLIGSRLGEKKQDKIRRILGFSNSAELRVDIEKRFGRADSILHVANGLYGVAQYDIALAKSALRLYADGIEAGERLKAKSGEGSVQATPSHQTPGGFGQDKNLVDLGCLFRVASAVNSSDARRLVSLINPKAMAQTAADELNLGRLTVFILGLQQASRRYTLTVVASICSEEQWRKQYDENEELENLIHYARSLGRIDSKKSAEFVRFLFKNYGSEIAESLKVQANILMISNWVRVLAQIEGEFLEQYGKSLADTLQRAAKDETRLWHLLEATESLINIKAYQEAKNLCKYILDETQSMASVRNLRNWLTIINKALYIERKLALNNFTADLTSSMHDLQLPVMVASEGQVILSAFAYQLFSINPTSSLTRLRAAILGYQRAIIEAANEDSDSTAKIISLTLAQAPIDIIAVVVKNVDWLQTSAWELGLAALLFDALSADDGQGLPLSLDTQSPEFNKFLLNGLNEHSTNLEFALTLYLTRRLNLDIQMSAVSETEIAERLEGESSSATRWLLQHYENPKTLKGLPYFIWYYLKETVLRPTYLPWTNNIEHITDNVAFRQPYRMDLSDLSSS